MAAYVINQCEVTDPVQYEAYKTVAQESIAAAGGRYLVRGCEVTVLEGEPPAGRVVVAEFPNREAALAWYRGATYSAARKLRASAAVVRMFVVDGVA